MENKYLEKIASPLTEGAKQFGRDFAKGWKRSSTTSKVGLGMSGVGLTMSAANYHNSIGYRKDNHERSKLEQKSISLLEDIAKGIKKPPKVVVKVDHPITKQAGMYKAKHLVAAATQLTKSNPGLIVGGVLGGVDGAASTTHQKNESYAKTVLRGIRNTTTGAASGAVVGKAIEMGYKHLKNKAGE